jgi:hypothetical protein
VLLSYASEDRAIAERIFQLVGGDDWETKIVRNVEACALFLPIVSEHTLTWQNRFFRHEWLQALTHKKGFPANARCLIPVAIDGTQPRAPELPSEFGAINWERLPEGRVTPEFVGLIREEFQQAQRRERNTRAPA